MKPQEALTRIIEHREIFHDEMLSLMRQIMSGEVSPVLIAALVLVLPLPIPFTNSFPAWAILLVAAGLLERDGLFILAGYLIFALGVLYFIFLGEAATALLQELVQWIRA